MANSDVNCARTGTNTIKRLSHQEYYSGKVDKEQRRNGYGENHWTGAESLESYNGNFVLNTLHGKGDYKWRYLGPEGAFFTYEGHFYGNEMHGYGLLSYADGRVFKGLFHKNMRWGPGVESHACAREDVGLWRGPQLIKLAWRPNTPSVTLDLTGPIGKACVDPHRIIFAPESDADKVNSAIELLKLCGTEPIDASEKWPKLYPKYCNDLDSQACHLQKFERSYYKHGISEFEEIEPTYKNQNELDSNKDIVPMAKYFAWNNGKVLKHMMKHCYKHEHQSYAADVNITNILCGPRSIFKPPSAHEIDCRTLLMASYLGQISNVTKLINSNNVHPDVSDIQGNTALIYATCGDQPHVMHFLVEAGADVNCLNDSCCTALSLALMKLLCVKNDVPNSCMVQCLLPKVLPVYSNNDSPSEWYIDRDAATESGAKLRRKSNTKNLDLKMEKSPNNTEIDTETTTKEVDSSDENQIYKNVNFEFSTHVTNVFSSPINANSIKYLFEVEDMMQQLQGILNEDVKKAKVVPPKKETTKSSKHSYSLNPSKDALWQVAEEIVSVSSSEKIKLEMFSRTAATAQQLLDDGADPRLVRCPQPALFMAILSGCADLIKKLVQHGANANEVYPDTYGYTALDLAVSRPLTLENLHVVQTLLICGARTDHRLKEASPEVINTNGSYISSEVRGPTLLHVMLEKNVETENEFEVQRKIIELLLKYDCDSLAQFNGLSAVDMVMSSMSLFEVFIKSPKVNLNAVINNSKQTILSKMFYMPFSKTIPVAERLQTLTNLLLFGADPFLEYEDEVGKYDNLFDYARKTCPGLEPKPHHSNNSPDQEKVDTKVKKDDSKTKKDDKKKKDNPVVSNKLLDYDLVDYKQSLNLVIDCARIILVRWLQTKLMKELIKIILKREHLHWTVILRKFSNKTACGLWLSCPRCLEIWDIIRPLKKKNPNDHLLIRHVLHIVQFCKNRSQTSFKHPISAAEKNMIEADVKLTIKEHKPRNSLLVEEEALCRPYVMPERFIGASSKLDVCFECFMYFGNITKIICTKCKEVGFCSITCIKQNIERPGCHPCSDYLRSTLYSSVQSSMEKL